MSYDLHITRASYWGDAGKTPITEDEWLAYVRSDPELRLTADPPVVELDVPSQETIRWIPAVWVAHGRYSEKAADSQVAFVLGKGRVTVERPDDETLKKMLEVAKRLRARVQGDDGEFYD